MRPRQSAAPVEPCSTVERIDPFADELWSSPPPAPPSPRPLILLAAGAFGLLLAFGLWAWLSESRLARLQAENQSLESELAPLRSLADVSSLEAAAADLERRQEVVAGLAGARGEGAALLAALASSVPPSAWLTFTDWDGASVQVQGLGFDATAAADVMDGMRATGCFEAIELVSVDVPGAGEARRFSIRAADKPTPCGVTRGERTDPFTPPHDPSKQPDVMRPPLLRWPVDLYTVTALVPGRSATVRDPDGRTHELVVGAMLGNPAARVTFVTDAAVLLSQDEMVEAATDTVQSRILELPLDPGTE